MVFLSSKRRIKMSELERKSHHFGVHRPCWEKIFPSASFIPGLMLFCSSLAFAESSPVNAELEPVTERAVNFSSNIENHRLVSETVETEDQKVVVSVRVIRATGRVPEIESVALEQGNSRTSGAARGAGSPKRVKLDIDPRLRDISKQLRKFHFTKFELLSAQRKTVDVMRRDVIQLVDGHRLLLRPTYLEDNRVGMWLKWKDGSGQPLLDTRVHFPCGKTVMAGTEIDFKKKPRVLRVDGANGHQNKGADLDSQPAVRAAALAARELHEVESEAPHPAGIKDAALILSIDAQPDH